MVNSKAHLMRPVYRAGFYFCTSVHDTRLVIVEETEGECEETNLEPSVCEKNCECHPGRDCVSWTDGSEQPGVLTIDKQTRPTQT